MKKKPPEQFTEDEKIYDGEPPPPKPPKGEKRPPMYTGDYYIVSLNGLQGDLKSLPGMIHDVIVDKSIVSVKTEDLIEGLFLQVEGLVGVISHIEKGVYHGLLVGGFFGRLSDLDSEGKLVEISRKKFWRDIYEDGRVIWRYEEVEDQPMSS
jgi:hypothetical protein